MTIAQQIQTAKTANNDIKLSCHAQQLQQITAAKTSQNMQRVSNGVLSDLKSTLLTLILRVLKDYVP